MMLTISQRTKISGKGKGNVLKEHYPVSGGFISAVNCSLLNRKSELYAMYLHIFLVFVLSNI